MTTEASVPKETDEQLVEEIQYLKIEILKQHLYDNREIIYKMNHGWNVNMPFVKILEDETIVEDGRLLQLSPSGEWSDRVSVFGEELEKGLSLFAYITDPEYRVLDNKYFSMLHQLDSNDQNLTETEYEQRVDSIWEEKDEALKEYLKKNRRKILTGFLGALKNVHSNQVKNLLY